MKSAGATVAFIGVGAPWMAQGFDEEFKLTGEGAQVLTDPSRESFRAAGMKHGIWRTMGPGTWVGAVRAFLSGSRQGKTQGDPWQQGGAVIVDRSGEIRFRHVNQHAADNVAVSELEAALAKARPAA